MQANYTNLVLNSETFKYFKLSYLQRSFATANAGQLAVKSFYVNT